MSRFGLGLFSICHVLGWDWANIFHKIEWSESINGSMLCYVFVIFFLSGGTSYAMISHFDI